MLCGHCTACTRLVTAVLRGPAGCRRLVVCLVHAAAVAAAAHAGASTALAALALREQSCPSQKSHLHPAAVAAAAVQPVVRAAVQCRRGQEEEEEEEGVPRML